MQSKRVLAVFGILFVLLAGSVAYYLLEPPRTGAPEIASINLPPTPAPTPSPTPEEAPQPPSLPMPGDVSIPSGRTPVPPPPTPTPVPTPDRPLPPSRKMDIPGRIDIHAVESGTNQPIEGVDIFLQHEDGSAPYRDKTNSEGLATYFNMPSGVYEPVLKWGRIPEVKGGAFRLPPGEGIEITIPLPGRNRYRAQLLDEGLNPVSGRKLAVAVSNYEWGEIGPIEYEEAVTDDQGIFYIAAYPESRPIRLKAAEGTLLSMNVKRGWTNPLMDPRALGAERSIHPSDPPVRRYFIREDAVFATGKLVNAPEPGGDGYFASVRSSQFGYMSIPVVDNEFSFHGVVGAQCTVVISRDRNAYVSLGGASREAKVEVTLPDEPGQFDFEIPFAERVAATGRVVDPKGSPAEDVGVRAVGFLKKGTAAEVIAPGERFAAAGAAQWRRNLTMVGDISFVTGPTGTDGEFFFHLPLAAEYLFVPEPGGLPEETLGGEPVIRTWEDLQRGEEIVLRLEISSLVWGTVINAIGRPVDEAGVMLAGPMAGIHSMSVSAQTDTDGVFEMNVPHIDGADTLPRGSTQLYLEAWKNESKGFAPVRLDDPEAVEIVLHPVSSGDFVVLDEGGEPVTRVDVSSYYDVDGFNEIIPRRDLQTFESEEGRYRFRSVPRGITWFAFSRPGVEDAVAVTKQIPADANAKQDIFVTLPRPSAE